MKITIELTQEQLLSISDQQSIEWGLPTLDEQVKFGQECNAIVEGLNKLGPSWGSKI